MQMIRKKTKVRGHCGSDFSYTCFCCCFALAQEARHLDAKPYKGGEIIPLPRWRKCLLPCFPVRKRDDRLLKSAREVCMSGWPAPGIESIPGIEIIPEASDYSRVPVRCACQRSTSQRQPWTETVSLHAIACLFELDKRCMNFGVHVIVGNSSTAP